MAVTIDGSTGVTYSDNIKHKYGTGEDLEVSHNGTDSHIDNNTGDLYLTTTGSGDDIHIRAVDDVQIKVQGTENAIIASGNGSVDLYHDNIKKFETTAAGTAVTGYQTQSAIPNFLASGLSNASTSAATDSGGTLLFNTIRHNNGSHYDSSTGRFTAPVAGYYQVNCHILIDNSASSNHNRAAVQKNGSDYNVINYNRNVNTEYHGQGGSLIVQCAANDYLSIDCGSGVHIGTETHFSAHLIG
jgi:hypothetical protein